MNYNPDTFCAAAWFGMRNEQFGEFRVCSKIDTSASQYVGDRDPAWPAHTVDQFVNSEYPQYLRQNLTAGQQLSECHRCWKAEHMGQASARSVSNHTVTGNHGHELSKTWVHAYMSRKQDYLQDHMILADVKLTNTCNFACAMCNPADSSRVYAAWARNPSHAVVQMHLEKTPHYLDQVKEHFVDKNNHQLLAQLLLKQPRHIKLLGGEPLLDQTVLTMLSQHSAAEQTKLSFVTNGSVELIKTSARLSRYRSVHYTVSLDGVGAVQDYIRRGSNWQQISANIQQFAQQWPNRINVHATVQALNLAHFSSLVAWCQHINIPLTFDLVQNPAYLSVAAIPPELRNLDQLIPWGQLTAGLVEHVTNTPHQPQLLAQLRQFINWYDQAQQWTKVVPEWQGWLN